MRPLKLPGRPADLLPGRLPLPAMISEASALDEGESVAECKRVPGLAPLSGRYFCIAGPGVCRLKSPQAGIPATIRQGFAPKIPLKGTSNADSQRYRWNSRGRRRWPTRCDSCCLGVVLGVVPPYRRTASSYRPLRAVWAVVPGHSGALRDHPPPERPSDAAHLTKGIFR